MSNPAATVKLEQVNKRFGEFAAVSDLSLAAYPRRIYGLFGPNGAGKQQRSVVRWIRHS